MPEKKEPFQRYIGDGLYMNYDGGMYVRIAVNDHRNNVAAIEDRDIEKAIEFLNRCKKIRDDPND